MANDGSHHGELHDVQPDETCDPHVVDEVFQGQRLDRCVVDCDQRSVLSFRRDDREMHVGQSDLGQLDLGQVELRQLEVRQVSRPFRAPSARTSSPGDVQWDVVPVLTSNASSRAPLCP